VLGDQLLAVLAELGRELLVAELLLKLAGLLAELDELPEGLLEVLLIGIGRWWQCN